MITVLLTFCVNLFLVYTFLGLVSMFYPLTGADWLLRLAAFLHIAPTEQSLLLLLSVIILAVPCLLSGTSIMQRYLCWSMGCRVPAGDEAARLEAAMRIVCEGAGLDRSDYNLYVCNIKQYNAFSVGSNNIAITQMLLNSLYIPNVAGVLAHEMGHIQHHDTKKMLAVYVMGSFGNLVIQIYSYIAVLMQLLGFIPVIGWISWIMSWILMLQIAVFRFLMQLPVKIISLFGTRQDEFEADRYACSIGLGNELYDSLVFISQGEKTLSTFERLLSDHPATADRLEKIRNYAATVPDKGRAYYSA